jgi:hypothetical protein
MKLKKIESKINRVPVSKILRSGKILEVITNNPGITSLFAPNKNSPAIDLLKKP